MTRRDLEAPTRWQSEVWDYRWQNLIKVVDVDRLEKIISGRKFIARPEIPASRISVRRMAKAVDGLLPQGGECHPKLQMRLAGTEIHAEALTHRNLSVVHER